MSQALNSIKEHSSQPALPVVLGRRVLRLRRGDSRTSGVIAFSTRQREIAEENVLVSQPRVALLAERQLLYDSLDVVLNRGALLF